jgi:16S rRNA processing protein RimM
VGVFGLRGQLKVTPWTEYPERFAPGARVWVRGELRRIESAHWHRHQVRLKLDGVDTPEQAESLRGEVVEAAIEDRPELEPGTYFADELLGMRVVSEQGAEIGQVEAVLPFPAHNVLQVDGVLIPFIREFVREVRVAERELVVRLIPGMGPGELAEEV